jgi:hypothetical protein
MTVVTAISVLLIGAIAMEAIADDIDGELEAIEAIEAIEETKETTPQQSCALSDSELDARLRFIEQRLDGNETYTKVWQWGWTAGYAIGIASGTYEAVDTDSNENRAYYIVTAAKGLIGTTRMILDRHPGRNGADPMREVSGNSCEAKTKRLAKGEELLQKVADRAEKRTDWKSHAGNVALNTVGSAFILGFGYQDDAAKSFGIGVGVGTLQILSAPKRGIQDLEDYQTRFGMKTASRFNWMIVPTVGGVALHVTF